MMLCSDSIEEKNFLDSLEPELLKSFSQFFSRNLIQEYINDGTIIFTSRHCSVQQWKSYTEIKGKN